MDHRDITGSIKFNDLQGTIIFWILLINRMKDEAEYRQS